MTWADFGKRLKETAITAAIAGPIQGAMVHPFVRNEPQAKKPLVADQPVAPSAPIPVEMPAPKPQFVVTPEGENSDIVAKAGQGLSDEAITRVSAKEPYVSPAEEPQNTAWNPVSQATGQPEINVGKSPDYPQDVSLITAKNKGKEPAKVTYQDGFESVYNKAFDNPENELHKISYPLNEQEVNQIKENTGLDVSGFNRTIDNYSIRHILNTHGNEKTESARGQIAITKDDISRIPEIIITADEISSAEKTRVGRDGILYKKKINGFVYYIEEVRGKHNELNPVSMWKVKSTTSDAPPLQESPSDTSEAFRFSSPSESERKLIWERSGNPFDKTEPLAPLICPTPTASQGVELGARGQSNLLTDDIVSNSDMAVNLPKGEERINLL